MSDSDVPSSNVFHFSYLNLPRWAQNWVSWPLLKENNHDYDDEDPFYDSYNERDESKMIYFGSEIKNTHDKIVAISAVDPGHCSVAAGSAYKVHSQGY